VVTPSKPFSLSPPLFVPRVMQHCIPFANQKPAFRSTDLFVPKIAFPHHLSLLSSDPFSSVAEARKDPQFFGGRGSALAGLGRQILALLASASLSCINQIFNDDRNLSTPEIIIILLFFLAPTHLITYITWDTLIPYYAIRLSEIGKGNNSRTRRKLGVHKKDSAEGKLVLHNTHEQNTERR
jgi:hypothetical protein